MFEDVCWLEGLLRWTDFSEDSQNLMLKYLPLVESPWSYRRFLQEDMLVSEELELSLATLKTVLDVHDNPKYVIDIVTTLHKKILWEHIIVSFGQPIQNQRNTAAPTFEVWKEFEIWIHLILFLMGNQIGN